MKTHISLKLLVLLTLIALVAAALNACANSVAPGEPGISVEPRSGGPGTAVTVSGSKFPPGIELNVRLGPPSIGATPQSYAKAGADERGEFALTFEMPDQWPDGTPITAQELLIVALNEDGNVKATASFDFAPSLAASRPIPMPAPSLAAEVQPSPLTAALIVAGSTQPSGNDFLLQGVEAGTPASPIATSPAIRFAAWSSDSRWVAYWLSSQEDVDNIPPYSFPAGTLYLANVETGESCAVPEFVRQDGATIHWSDDGAVIVGTVVGWFTGQPCQDEAYAPLADYVPDDSPAPDPAISPDGRYRAATALQSGEDGILTFETTLVAGDQVRPLQRVTWQIDQRLGDYGLGGEWVSPIQFLVYETLTQGPLILDVEGGLVSVLAEWFDLQEIPSILGEQGYNLRAVAVPGLEADTFHLLLTGVGLDENFPSVTLYHAESGLVETLPYPYAWWTPFSDDGLWLLMDTRPSVNGYESHAIWIRRVEDVGGAWQHLATGVDSAMWADGWTEMAFSDHGIVTWQTFPDAQVIGRWDTGQFGTYPVAWSPDGRYLVTEGNVAGLWQYGLFLLERPVD